MILNRASVQSHYRNDTITGVCAVLDARHPVDGIIIVAAICCRVNYNAVVLVIVAGDQPTHVKED